MGDPLSGVSTTSASHYSCTRNTEGSICECWGCESTQLSQDPDTECRVFEFGCFIKAPDKQAPSLNTEEAVDTCTTPETHRECSRRSYDLSSWSHQHFMRPLHFDLFSPREPDQAVVATVQQPALAMSIPPQQMAPLGQLVLFSVLSSNNRYYATEVKTFDLLTLTLRSSTPLITSFPFNFFSRYTLVDNCRVYVCGYRDPPATNKSTVQADYLVNLTSGQVESLQPLGVPRCGPGVLHHNGELFVLGHNDDTPGREVEMLQHLDSSQEWTRLPDMNAGRFKFSPCVHKGRAYLCFASDVIVDILELRTRRFLDPLPIKLPREQLDAALTAVFGDKLVIITQTYTTTLDLVSREITNCKHKRLEYGPMMKPVQYGDMIYWVNWGDECACVSGSSWDVVEHTSLVSHS